MRNFQVSEYLKSFLKLITLYVSDVDFSEKFILRTCSAVLYFVIFNIYAFS